MKQYILLCGEDGVSKLQSILIPNTIQFLEVQGMSMGDEGKFNLLVTPIPQSVEAAQEIV